MTETGHPRHMNDGLTFDLALPLRPSLSQKRYTITTPYVFFFFFFYTFTAFPF